MRHRLWLLALVVMLAASACDSIPRRSHRQAVESGHGITGRPVEAVRQDLRVLDPANSREPGSFRTTCEAAFIERWDPLDLRGAAGGFGARSHVHMFFGAVETSPDATPESLRRSPSSTCSGGALNNTLYWVPAMMDRRALEGMLEDRRIDDRDPSPYIEPDIAWMYYKGADGSHCGRSEHRSAPLPGCFDIPENLGGAAANLRMIADLANQPPEVSARTWSCSARPGQVGPSIGDVVAAGGCPVGSYLEMTIPFPTCWDGVNDWKVDRVGGVLRQTHVVYEMDGNADGVADARYWEELRCPASHPKVLPQISMNLRFEIRPGDDISQWLLTSDLEKEHRTGKPVPAGSTAHGDWMNGWDTNTATQWWQACLGGPVNGQSTLRSCANHISAEGSTSTQMLGQGDADWRIIDETVR